MQNSIQQKMFRRVRRWQNSGLKQTTWCKQQNIAYATFHYWYKRYRQEEQVTQKSSGDDFIKLNVSGPVHDGYWCELSFASGKKLVFQQPVSAEFLRSLID